MLSGAAAARVAPPAGRAGWRRARRSGGCSTTRRVPWRSRAGSCRWSLAPHNLDLVDVAARFDVVQVAVVPVRPLPQQVAHVALRFWSQARARSPTVAPALAVVDALAEQV